VYTSANGAASVFGALREEVPIRRLMESNGHRKILCVNHSEKTPSMHVYEDHVHCYGCGFHGDVVDVWAIQKGIDRPIEAAFDLARAFNVLLPEMSEEARQRAQERREKEADDLRLAQVCHDALDKHPHVRDWWEARGFGADLRERFLLGANKDGTAAVIPFWHRGRVMGLVRRQLEREPKYLLPKAEEFPEGYRPLFIPAPIKGEVSAVEGYIDALAVAASGRSSIAIGGTDISDAQREELQNLMQAHEGVTIYILTDDDESGKEAARTWGRQFFPRARVCPPSYGEAAKDIADTFAREEAEKTAEHLDRLITTSKDMVDIETEAAVDIKGGAREKLAYATQNIVPLLTGITPEVMRDATVDIIVDQVKGLKKNWISKAIKAEEERIMREMMQAVTQKAEADAERRAREHQEEVASAQDEINALLAVPGVLGRLRDTAARMHNVRRDEKALELSLLVALGAQLEPLGNGRPLGASMLITAQAGRGKNHIVDAAVKPLPPEFYFAFEIASGQSLYYKADEDPEFLKYTFAYPNEIEGAEQLWEFLRPMLSKGSAHKIVTAKDADGNMTTREITVEGPTTIAIPTIRNKTDEQLQTRLLVAELPDYPGRVKEHSAAFSAQLLPDAAISDYSHEVFLWQEGLRQLTAIRRVIFPLKHRDFAVDNDQISHGARLWANLLSLMVTHAWLEQRNRRILELGDSAAIEATPDDYEAAYAIFNEVCKRTVVNLSGTHRSILDGLHDLMNDNPERDGFRQREIAEAGGVSLGAVSTHKTYLVTSAKLIKESEDGLSLVEGADPSWWETGQIMEGLPTPPQVWSWWEERDPDPPDPPEHGEHMNTGDEGEEKRHNYAGSGVHAPDEQTVNADPPSDAGGEQDERVHGLFTEDVNSQNGAGMGNDPSEEDPVHAFTASEGAEEEASKGPAREYPSVVYVEGRDKGEYVYVGRSRRYGGPHYFHNPFPVEEYGRKESLRLYGDHLYNKLLVSGEGQRELEVLAAEVAVGKSLGCHCAGRDGTPEALTADDELFCHGQLLLAAMAARGEDPSFLDDEEEL
jgi:DNA primase